MKDNINWKTVSRLNGYKALMQPVHDAAASDNKRKQKGWNSWDCYKRAKENFIKVMNRIIATANHQEVNVEHLLISIWHDYTHYKLGKQRDGASFSDFTSYCLRNFPVKRSKHVKPQGIRGLRKYYKGEVKRSWVYKPYATRRMLFHAQHLARKSRTKKPRWEGKRKQFK